MTETTTRAHRHTPNPHVIEIGGYPPVRIVLVWEHAAHDCAAWKDERINSIPGELCYSTECGYRAHLEEKTGTDWLGEDTWQEPPCDDTRWVGIALQLVQYIANNEAPL